MKLQPVHRARRFAANLLGRGPDAQDMAWADARLSERERRAFHNLRGPDRAHSVAVARAVAAHVPAPEPWVVTAALLHDVGKSVPDLGTYGRVVATLSSWAAPDMAEHWADTTGFTRKVGLYMKYPELGADLLEVAGSDARVVAWAREHHMAERDWTIPVEAGRLLQAADDGRL